MLAGHLQLGRLRPNCSNENGIFGIIRRSWLHEGTHHRSYQKAPVWTDVIVSPINWEFLNDGDVLGERFQPCPVRLDDSNRDVTCLSCFNIRNDSRFSFMCAANDFTLSAIFELLRWPDPHVVKLTTGER